MFNVLQTCTIVVFGGVWLFMPSVTSAFSKRLAHTSVPDSQEGIKWIKECIFDFFSQHCTDITHKQNVILAITSNHEIVGNYNPFFMVLA